jgi:uncharacterized membrane protein YhaH (DUF805 family)
MHWMIEPLRRYADFTGRSRRTEFWMFFLAQMLLFLVWIIMFIGVIGIAAAGDVARAGGSSPALGMGMIVLSLLWLLVILATAIPNAAVVVRRFHDIGQSGWIGGILYGLTFLFNIVGLWIINIPGLILIVFMFIEGTRGSNQYGPDPKAEGSADIFA